ncbi:MAG: hypothetical protein ABJ327_25120 [Litoreibacter sp.]
MHDSEYPIIIRDDAQFNALVKVLKYGNHWEDFNFIYEDKQEIPKRLHGFTILASNDPNERYGALLQVDPLQAETDVNANYTGRKLLAKIRIN